MSTSRPQVNIRCNIGCFPFRQCQCNFARGSGLGKARRTDLRPSNGPCPLNCKGLEVFSVGREPENEACRSSIQVDGISKGARSASEEITALAWQFSWPIS